MNAAARKPAAAGDTFRHHTGREYVVIVVARDDDEPQDLVIHRGLHDGRVWSRPMKNFMGYLAEGQPRFSYTGGLMTPTEPAPAEPSFSGTREDYEDIESYAVAAMIGNIARFATSTQVAVEAFDVAEAMLAEKKARLGEKPDYTL